MRQLYERLLAKTKHVKVWLSFAKFESDTTKDIERARQIYEEAYAHFKKNEKELKEERLMILENWLRMEETYQLNEGEFGDESKVEYVKTKLPKRVKKRRKVNVVN